MLGLISPALGLGGWARPAAASERSELAEPGLHAGPSNHGDPAERTCEPPLCGETKDPTEDKDSSDAAVLCVGPSFDLDLAAAIRGHRFADAHDGGPASSHRGALHIRGPPVA